MNILIHYNEIALKKGNRDYFEKKLIKNIRERIEKDFPGSLKGIDRYPGRFIVEIEDSSDKNILKKVFENIFGIHNFSFVTEVEQNMEDLKEAGWRIMREGEFETFRVETKRSNKNFPFTSEEINREVGGYIYEKLEKAGLAPKVNLGSPDKTCFIEIFNKKAFIFSEKIKGLGGMPIGSSGKALALLSGGIDSPVAAYYGLKRGVSVDFIHFHSLPYTSEASNEKVEALAKKLLKFQTKARIFMVPFANVQKQIVMNSPEKLRVVMYRRLMMRIAERVCEKNNYQALYTGESVAQVASQTLENITATNDALENIPVLRPLIGFDKLEIIEVAKKIDTYEISIIPHEDCCTRFIPKHPETKANLEEVREVEKNLDIEKLVEKAVEEMEVISIK